MRVPRMPAQQECRNTRAIVIRVVPPAEPPMSPDLPADVPADEPPGTAGTAIDLCESEREPSASADASATGRVSCVFLGRVTEENKADACIVPPLVPMTA